MLLPHAFEESRTPAIIVGWTGQPQLILREAERISLLQASEDVEELARVIGPLARALRVHPGFDLFDHAIGVGAWTRVGSKLAQMRLDILRRSFVNIS